jgi:hypothetical protein
MSPFILGLYEDYDVVVYRVIDREGCTRILETEFAVKRQEDGRRIAMLGTTRLLKIIERPRPTSQLGTSVRPRDQIRIP